MMKNRNIIVIGILLLITTVTAFGAAKCGGEGRLPIPLDDYDTVSGLWETLVSRVAHTPFNLVSTIMFLCAIVHTFLASKITRIAHRKQVEHEKKLVKEGIYDKMREDAPVCYQAEILHFLGEIEAVFGIWVLPLMIAIISFYGWSDVVGYMDTKVNYLEPVFVVVIMIIASTRPILKLAEVAMAKVAKIGKSTPFAWWFAILTFGPILGSFITEPAAMTICALLLGDQFYKLNPSKKLSYATLGLLFVNVSIGGTLTHFAAPPVLMVAGTWGWDISFMMANFGWKAALGIVSCNLIYYLYFKKDFLALKDQVAGYKETRRAAIADEDVRKDKPIPIFVTFVHVLFLAWTVFNLHHITLFLGGFLFFLAFTRVTLHHQYRLKIRSPLLVGFFLAGLVTHGTLQQWWIAPVLSSLGEIPLFIGSVALTAFNDNAAITFLASLVPEFANNISLQKAVVEGAVAGGGLTVIANAPNPAGQSILNRYFEGGISPLYLFLGAIIPTIIVSFIFIGI